MINLQTPNKTVNIALIASLTYAMFFMFAMTTDAVGEIIKIAKTEMNLSNTDASAFHWATMVAIGFSGIALGFLADRFGRKFTIILGLSIYMVASALFMAGESFKLYFVLLFVSGLAIGVFKTAALALIGDISTDADDHTRKMNLVEGFFGIGAIVGPWLVVTVTANGLPWTLLYGFAAALCLVMVVLAAFTQYPEPVQNPDKPASLLKSLRLIRNPYALGFSFAIAMYVASEVAIFVWMPTLLEAYTGQGFSLYMAANSVMIFFILRAAGRFLCVALYRWVRWEVVVMLFTGLILACFVISAIIGVSAAVYLLPLSGLFMSTIYPTLNSKGISCFPKSEHGSVAGLILFFTALSAALAPLAMALVADGLFEGDMRYGFLLATGFAATVFVLAIYNWLVKPATNALAQHADH